MKEPGAKYLTNRGYKHTEIGTIPEDWDVALLDSVAKRGSGHTPDKAHPEYWDGQIKWISLQDSDQLDHLYIYDTAAKVTPSGIANSSAKIHSAGTVVLSRDAGVGKSAIMKDEMAVSQHFMAWKCGIFLNNHFLYYWLQANKTEFERIAMGSTIKTIGLPYFKKLAIPLPSKTEQEFIAEALSDADALIESLEQLLAKKRHLKQGAMQELLTGKRRLPGFSEIWKEATLSALGKCHRGVSYNPAGDLSPHDTKSTVRLLRSNNIQEGAIVFAGLQYVDRDRVSEAQCLRTNDIVICMANGSRDLVGKAARFSAEDGFEYTFGAFMGCFRPDAGADSNFVFYLFQTEKYRTHISILLAGSSINNLTPSNVEALLIAVPSDNSEQSAIAAILSDMDAEIAALETKLTKARQLKQGMMQELLTGRIRLV